jgi:hypothetical protein
MCNISIHGLTLTREGEFAECTMQGHRPKCYSQSPLLQNSGNPGSLGQSFDPRRLGDEGALDPVKGAIAIELPSITHIRDIQHCITYCSQQGFASFEVDIPAAYYSQ